MKITQESLPKSQLGLRVEIPAEDVAKRHDIVFKKFQKNVRLPGFRQGKVPPHILRQFLGDVSIGATVVEELLETAMPQALQLLGERAIGEPRLRDEMETLVQNYQPRQPFVFQLAIDVWPEVTLGDYQNLQIRAHKYEFDPERVEDMLYMHQYNRATLVPVERPAQDEDVVIIDLDGYHQTETGRGEGVEHFHWRDMQVDLDLDAGECYPEVLEGLVGMRVGETKEVILVTDGESWAENLANQTFILEFTLKELKERELPELDDLFAQAVSDCETMTELRVFLTEREQKEVEERTENSIYQALTDALLEITTTELPHTLVERNLEDLFTDVLNGFRRRGVDPKELNTWLTEERVQEICQELLPKAENQVKRFLALKAVAEQENLTPDPEVMAAEMAVARRVEPGSSLSPAELEQVVRGSLRLKMAMTYLQEQAQITWVSQEERLAEMKASFSEALETTTLSSDESPVAVVSEPEPEALEAATPPVAVVSEPEPEALEATIPPVAVVPEPDPETPEA